MIGRVQCNFKLENYDAVIVDMSAVLEGDSRQPRCLASERKSIHKIKVRIRMLLVI